LILKILSAFVKKKIQKMILQLIIVTSDYIFIDDDSILAFDSQETVRPTDVWIESSAIAVLTIFCSLI